jgi:N-methylhydantoinase B/oxoprolinase/acetone carboxylase alpha subunit
MNNVTFGGMFEDNTFVFYETLGGGHGAGPKGDGLSGRHCHMTNTRNTPVEALEGSLPVEISAYQLIPESGGKGLFNGGNGVKRVYRFLAPASVTINSDRRTNPPYGLQGGTPGKVGHNKLIRDGEELIISSKESFQVKEGDLLIICTPGGGGWGKPADQSGTKN